MFNPEDQHYIGDGVYASVDNGFIKLRTERLHGTNEIYLDQQVYQELLKFEAQVSEYYANIDTTEPTDSDTDPDTNNPPI